MTKSKTDGRVLRDAVRRLIVAHGALEEARRPCGTLMSLPNAYALLELYSSKEPLTVSELAGRLAIDRTNVSRLCSRMEQSGELSRRQHPNDGRAVALVLTAKGKRLAKAVDEASAGHFARLAEELGGHTRGVTQALLRLNQAMTSMSGARE